MAALRCLCAQHCGVAQAPSHGHFNSVPPRAGAGAHSAEPPIPREEEDQRGTLPGALVALAATSGTADPGAASLRPGAGRCAVPQIGPCTLRAEARSSVMWPQRATCVHGTAVVHVPLLMVASIPCCPAARSAALTAGAGPASDPSHNTATWHARGASWPRAGVHPCICQGRGRTGRTPG